MYPKNAQKLNSRPVYCSRLYGKSQINEYKGLFEILMITLISSKKQGGYKIMSNTVEGMACQLSIFGILFQKLLQHTDRKKMSKLFRHKNKPSFNNLGVM